VLPEARCRANIHKIILKPKINPKIKMAGKINQPKNKTEPKIKIKISEKIPIKIKTLLTIAPKIREIILEKNASAYLLRSNPRP
jgi:predicted esterase YcpF (UPF0227 family)